MSPNPYNEDCDRVINYLSFNNINTQNTHRGGLLSRPLSEASFDLGYQIPEPFTSGIKCPIARRNSYEGGLSASDYNPTVYLTKEKTPSEVDSDVMRRRQSTLIKKSFDL